MPKYYAVLAGRQPGIYTTWDEARQQVDRFQGARFKSFPTYEEAVEYLRIGSPVPTPVPPSPVPTPIPPSPVPTPIPAAQPSSLPSPPPTPEIVAYCDGSCVREVGGYGIVLVTPTGRRAFKGRVPYDPCTNNIAELYAIYQTLQFPVTLIRTDSNYSIKSLTEWVHAWRRNGWRTARGTPVENQELIQMVLRRLEGKSVRFEHVYGHRGDPNNELADQLANAGRLL